MALDVLTNLFNNPFVLHVMKAAIFRTGKEAGDRWWLRGNVIPHTITMAVWCTLVLRGWRWECSVVSSHVDLLLHKLPYCHPTIFYSGVLDQLHPAIPTWCGFQQVLQETKISNRMDERRCNRCRLFNNMLRKPQHVSKVKVLSGQIEDGEDGFPTSDYFTTSCDILTHLTTAT